MLDDLFKILSCLTDENHKTIMVGSSAPAEEEASQQAKAPEIHNVNESLPQKGSSRNSKETLDPAQSLTEEKQEILEAQEALLTKLHEVRFHANEQPTDKTPQHNKINPYQRLITALVTQDNTKATELLDSGCPIIDQSHDKYKLAINATKNPKIIKKIKERATDELKSLLNSAKPNPETLLPLKESGANFDTKILGVTAIDIVKKKSPHIYKQIVDKTEIQKTEKNKLYVLV